MNRLNKLIAVFGSLVMVLALTTLASAQRRDRNDDDYNRDNGRNSRNDDDYARGNARNDRELRSTILNLKVMSKQFDKLLDRELDRSRIDETRREDQLNNLATRFKNAAKDLDDAYDNGRDYRRSRDEARRVLDLGSQLDRAMSRGRFSRSVQNSWSGIERQLRSLARAYNYSYNNRD